MKSLKTLQAPNSDLPEGNYPAPYQKFRTEIYRIIYRPLLSKCSKTAVFWASINGAVQMLF